jgi:hypothetical protein
MRKKERCVHDKSETGAMSDREMVDEQKLRAKQAQRQEGNILREDQT